MNSITYPDKTNFSFTINLSPKRMFEFQIQIREIPKEQEIPIMTDNNNYGIVLDKNFNKNLIPFTLKAFYKYLQQPQQEELNIQECNSVLLQMDQIYKNKVTIQKKYELNDLRNLIKDRVFHKLWSDFLDSQYIKNYINNNQKIKKERVPFYLKSLEMLKNELNNINPYNKFLRNTKKSISTESIISNVKVDQENDCSSYNQDFII